MGATSRLKSTVAGVPDHAPAGRGPQTIAKRSAQANNRTSSATCRREEHADNRSGSISRSGSLSEAGSGGETIQSIIGSGPDPAQPGSGTTEAESGGSCLRQGGAGRVLGRYLPPEGIEEPEVDLQSRC